MALGEVTLRRVLFRLLWSLWVVTLVPRLVMELLVAECFFEEILQFLRDLPVLGLGLDT